MMHVSTTLLLAATAATAATLTSAQATFQRSSKRGLVFVPSTSHPQDNQIWVEGNSDLTWYYNYQVSPSPAYSNRTQSEFEFVPMLWSPSTSFLSEVKSMISGGRNITHVLTYNEPDGTASTGGSNVDPSVAATNWISQVEPLRKLGVKTGAPAVTGSPSGFTWLSMFFDACASQGTNCTADFIPIHWYGNFEGLASHIGQVAGTYVFTTPLSQSVQKLTVGTATLTRIFGSPSMLSTTTHYPIHKASLIRPPNTSIVSLISAATHTSVLSEAMSAMSDPMLLC
jgi:hypothetical protein